MRSKSLTSILGASLMLLGVLLPAVSPAAESWPTDKECKNVKDPGIEVRGWCAAINRRKGNCLACHHLYVQPWPEGFPAAGNIGPTLVMMKVRFPDKAALRAQVWDATRANPNTVMPPFGRHKLLTEEEIDAIVEFLYSI